MPDCTYEGTRRVVYPSDEIGDAVFVPVCSKCGRFVRADSVVRFGGESAQPVEPNATCKRCGRVAMVFEGYF